MQIGEYYGGYTYSTACSYLYHPPPASLIMCNSDLTKTYSSENNPNHTLRVKIETEFFQ